MIDETASSQDPDVKTKTTVEDENLGTSVVAHLAEIVSAQGVQFFHDASMAAFARFRQDDRTHVALVQSTLFKRWLGLHYYRDTNRAAPREQLNSACDLFSARGLFDGDEHEVRLRSAPASEGGFDYWLANHDDVVVEVREEGWNVVPGDDRYFLSRDTTLPISTPQPGGEIELLRRYVSPATDADFILIVAWALMALQPTGPYPILVFQGEQGSGKSTATRVLKALLDPVKAPLRAAPRNEQDLVIAAQSNSVISIDNVSTLADATSNAFCRISTGGGYSTRRLYTTDEEAVFEQTRPLLVNGIEGVATRQDLLDRAVVVSLPRRELRLDESTLWEGVTRDAPKILGALLDGAAEAVRNWSETDVSGTRMADFQRRASAAMPAFGWTAEGFQEAYETNRADALLSSLDGTILPALLRIVIEKSGGFGGTPTQVYERLARVLENSDLRGNTFPKSPQSMSRQLRLLAPALRQIGVEFQSSWEGTGKAKKRWMEFGPSVDPSTQTSESQSE